MKFRKRRGREIPLDLRCSLDLEILSFQVKQVLCIKMPGPVGELNDKLTEQMKEKRPGGHFKK